MTKTYYTIACGLFMLVCLAIFFSTAYQMQSYLSIGSTVLTHSHSVPINNHGKIIYITQDQYRNLGLMSCGFIINLIVMGIFFYKAEIPYGKAGLDK